MHEIFVFGTLKEGFPNFGENDGLRVTGRYKTRDRYPLYLVGERCSPWMMDSAGTGHQVFGEIYQVDDNGLARMDRLERIGLPDGYIRVDIPVEAADSGEQQTVMVYLKPASQLDANDIQAGPFAEYTLSHAARYRPRN
jgi:gamma-glutamylaminecyclotransferase